LQGERREKKTIDEDLKKKDAEAEGNNTPSASENDVPQSHDSVEGKHVAGRLEDFRLVCFVPRQE
jgi:hypothetical protein